MATPRMHEIHRLIQPFQHSLYLVLHFNKQPVWFLAKAETKVHVRQRSKQSQHDAHEEEGISHKPWRL